MAVDRTASRGRLWCGQQVPGCQCGGQRGKAKVVQSQMWLIYEEVLGGCSCDPVLQCLLVEVGGPMT
jgi:hypothetical protein